MIFKIALLKQLWQKVNSIGSLVNNSSSRFILLSFLSAFQDPIIATLYTTTLFIEAFIQLNPHIRCSSHLVIQDPIRHFGSPNKRIMCYLRIQKTGQNNLWL